MTLTGDSEALEEGDILGRGNWGAVGRAEGLDSILHGFFACRLKHPSDLGGSVVVAHEGDGCRSGGFVVVGGWTEQGNDGRPEEFIEERGDDAANHAPPVLVPLRQFGRLLAKW